MALVVLSPHILTETVRKRILRLPLRQLVDGIADPRALAALWQHALAPPLVRLSGF